MRYRRILSFLAVASVSILSAGCLRVSYTLNLKPDGSGSIAKTIAVSKQNAAMLGGTSMLPNEAALRAEAAEMGAGVKFLSSTPYNTGGFEGVTAVYGFDDVTKLAVNMEDAVMGGVALPGTEPGDKPDPESEVKLTFTREGGSSVLVMRMPPVDEPDEETKKQMGQAAQQAENPQVEAMMKQMIGGALIEVAINIDGKIVNTNAPFVEGSKVLLVRMDGDELVKGGSAAKLMGLMQGGGDAKSMLAKVPGLKIVLLPEVRIEFR